MDPLAPDRGAIGHKRGNDFFGPGIVTIVVVYQIDRVISDALADRNIFSQNDPVEGTEATTACWPLWQP